MRSDTRSRSRCGVSARARATSSGESGSPKVALGQHARGQRSREQRSCRVVARALEELDGAPCTRGALDPVSPREERDLSQDLGLHERRVGDRERGLRQLKRPHTRSGQPLDAGQQQAGPPARGRRSQERLLSRLARTRGVAELEQVIGQRQAAPRTVGHCERPIARQLRQFGRRVRRATAPRRVGGSIEGSRNGRIGPVGDQREVSTALLGIGRLARELLVRAPPVAQRALTVGRCSQQRMPERHLATIVDDGQARRPRPPPRRLPRSRRVRAARASDATPPPPAGTLHGRPPAAPPGGRGAPSASPESQVDRRACARGAPAIARASSMA